MANNQEYEKYFIAIYALGCIFLAANVYYFSFSVFQLNDGADNLLHMVVNGLNSFFYKLKQTGMFSSMYKTKAWAYIMIVLASLPRTGKKTEMDMSTILLIFLVGSILFFLPTGSARLYILTSMAGLIVTTWGAELIGRKLKGGKFNEAKNDKKETFDQCTELIENDYSINIPTKFQYQGKIRDGWINIVAPFRGTAIYGIPGSGKSYSIYGPYIETMVQKEYALLIYDFKFPDLTEIVYNEALRKYPPEIQEDGTMKWNPKAPQFCVINYNDPRRSNRCNPVSTKYLKTQTDTAETAEVIMNNINPGQKDNKKDFFDMSAESYCDLNFAFLMEYKGGEYCSFPIFIELMSQNYEDLFEIFNSYESLKTKVKPFINAMKGGANEQLQGQIASAQVPLSKLASAELYWVMSGDDFDLDMNNPEAPKIICIGNDPDRQAVYSTANALYTTRTFKGINHPGKQHSGVLLDELPTMYVKGLDQLVNTARSNKVAVVFAAQDKSQLIRDYGKEYAEVVFNTIGNIFFGAVRGDTAKEFSQSFGKEFRRQESQTQSVDSESVNVSFHQEEILPVDVIESLSVGYFGGVMADDYGYDIDKKYFLSRIMIDQQKQAEKKKTKVKLPELTDFGKAELYKYIDEHEEEALTDSFMVTRELMEEISSKGITPSETMMQKYARDKVAALTPEERVQRLADWKEKSYDDLVEYTIQTNYKRIREEAENIVINELKRLGKTPKGKKSKPTPTTPPVNEIHRNKWMEKLERLSLPS